MRRVARIVHKFAIFIFPICLLATVVLLVLGYRAETGPLVWMRARAEQ